MRFKSLLLLTATTAVLYSCTKEEKTPTPPAPTEDTSYKIVYKFKIASANDITDATTKVTYTGADGSQKTATLSNGSTSTTVTGLKKGFSFKSILEKKVKVGDAYNIVDSVFLYGEQTGSLKQQKGNAYNPSGFTKDTTIVLPMSSLTI